MVLCLQCCLFNFIHCFCFHSKASRQLSRENAKSQYQVEAERANNDMYLKNLPPEITSVQIQTKNFGNVKEKFRKQFTRNESTDFSYDAMNDMSIFSERIKPRRDSLVLKATNEFQDAKEWGGSRKNLMAFIPQSPKAKRQPKSLLGYIKNKVTHHNSKPSSSCSSKSGGMARALMATDV